MREPPVARFTHREPRIVDAAGLCLTADGSGRVITVQCGADGGRGQRWTITGRLDAGGLWGGE